MRNEKKGKALLLVAVISIFSLFGSVGVCASETTDGQVIEDVLQDVADGQNNVQNQEQDGQQEENINADAITNESENINDTNVSSETNMQIPVLSYRAHVQNIGWQTEVKDGQMAGTTGLHLNMEAIVFNLEDWDFTNGTIRYQTHVQDIGWQNKVIAGQLAGTTGKNKAVEAIRIELTGVLAEQYDVYYRVHVTNFGWLGWASNGEAAGSQGFAYSAQAIEVKLIAKSDTNKPEKGEKAFCLNGTSGNIIYQAHVQDIGWMTSVSDGMVGGTTGKGKHLEALKISLSEEVTRFGDLSGDVICQTHVQDYGWLSEVSGENIAGTTGKNKHMEAVIINLTDDVADVYDVYYRVHVANYGWLGWAKNGEKAGTSGFNFSMEAIEIKLVEKESSEAPVQNQRSYLSKDLIGALTYQTYVEGEGWKDIVSAGNTSGTTGKNKSIQALKMNVATGSGVQDSLYSGGIEYSLYVQNEGWLGWVSADQVSSVVESNKKTEAVRVRLTGELASYANVYYRAHVSDYGWLDWAVNGQTAGTTKCNYTLQAIEVKIVPKYTSAPGATSNYYRETLYRVYQNPSSYYQIKDSISLSGGGYTLSYGFEGVKVMQVIRKLGLGSGIGMGGAFYSTEVQNAVANFQRNAGLVATGNVDLLTWLRLGFNELQWEQWGAYVSPMKVNRYSSRSDHIEAMISTAYSYLGTPYVIGASGPPGTGIDCSGLVMQGLYAAGMDISPINPVRHAYPGYEYESRNMWASAKFLHVPYEQRQRGDLIFYQNSSGTVIHVAIYLGNDTVIESWPNEVVVWPIKHWQRSNIKGVVRPFV